MKNRAHLIIIPLSLALSSWSLPLFAQTMEPLVPADQRFKVLTYDESDVYTINTKYGYQTNIVFAPSEEIQTISVGDRSVWQIVPSGNRLFIRPMEESATTNMTVLTNKHSYQFDLKSAAAGKMSDVVYVAKFTYPDDIKKIAPAAALAAISAPAAAPPPAPVPAAAPVVHTQPTPAMPQNSGGFNYQYTYSGPDELAPLQVFDNGKSTFIKYSDMSQPLPNAYIIDADGSERPTTYYVKDNFLVIDHVVGELALKSSSGTVKIYNELLDPR